MYHQLLKIGEDGIAAHIEYEIKDEDCPMITKITAFNPNDSDICHVIPVGALDLRQVEDMAEKLWQGHAAVVQALIDDARIDAYEDRQRDLEI